MWDSVWINAHLATLDEDGDYGIIEDGAVAVRNGKVVWVGKTADVDDDAECSFHDAKGKWMTPGLIDCHTHLVYGGNRAAEFEMRLNGVSYEEIAKQGGGIVSTVKATRAASEDELFEAAWPRLQG